MTDTIPTLQLLTVAMSILQSSPVASPLSTSLQRQRLTHWRPSRHSNTPGDQQQLLLQHRIRAASISTADSAGDAEPPHDASVQHEVPEGIAEPMSEEAVASEKQRRKKLWFAAVKPPMYTVSIIPILVGMHAKVPSTCISVSGFMHQQACF